MDLAHEAGRYDELAHLIEEHERAGEPPATTAPRRRNRPRLPVGVCTANAEAAARRTLEHLDALGASLGNTAFTGDERSDAETAAATETSFFHPRQLSD